MDIINQINNLPDGHLSGAVPDSIAVPSDYKEFALKLAGLEINGCFEIISPDHLEKSYNNWVAFISEYWFWGSSKLIDRDSALTFTPILYHAFGDEIVYRHSDQRWVVLPRDSEKTFGTIGNCGEMLRWIFESGKYYRKEMELTFHRLW